MPIIYSLYAGTGSTSVLDIYPVKPGTLIPLVLNTVVNLAILTTPAKSKVLVS